MNKLLKYTLVGLATISCLFACFSSATQTVNITSVGNYDSNPTNSNDVVYHIAMSQNVVGCMQCTDDNTNGYVIAPGNQWTVRFTLIHDGCFYLSSNYDIYLDGQSSRTCTLSITNPNYSSQQCQSEYSLIPISEVTPNYCALNFNMIDPSECPINSGTGAIVWSNLMINDTPYAQNQNINVFIPDFLAWNIAFNDFNTTIEVEGYNADTEYIENVIAKENLTPTNEDFGNMLTGLVNFFPYLAIAFIMYYLVRLIYKLFK